MKKADFVKAIDEAIEAKQAKQAMNVAFVPFQREHLANMAKQLKEVIYSYKDRVSVAEVMGILDIVKNEIYEEQRP